VRAGELDLAFTEFLGSPPRGVAAWMLACEPLAVVCPPDHVLAGRHGITLHTLVDEAFVELHADWGTRQLIDRSFRERRLTRRPGLEVNDLPTQLDLVAHGLGIALVPRAVIQHRIQERTSDPVGFAELAEPEICWELAVVFAHDEKRRPVNAITKMFLSILRSLVDVIEEADSPDVGAQPQVLAGDYT
jgi:DNA-binding transcriptional LysR family regulator